MDRVGEREREKQHRQMKQLGQWRDKQLTSLFQKDQAVGRVSMQRTKTQSGWDGRESPINAVQESTAVPISEQARPPF